MSLTSRAVRHQSSAPIIFRMTPKLVGLVVAHEETCDGPVTIIARQFDRPELCRLCPQMTCSHPSAGFCVVRVPAYVPNEEAASYESRPGL